MGHSTTPIQLFTGACRYRAGRLGRGAQEGRRSLPLPLLVDVSFSPRFNQGGLVGNDETVALTAFVVIALHHGLAVFPDKNSEQLKRVVRHPTCVPFADPLSPQESRCPARRPSSPLSSRKTPSQGQTPSWGQK